MRADGFAGLGGDDGHAVGGGGRLLVVGDHDHRLTQALAHAGQAHASGPRAALAPAGRVEADAVVGDGEPDPVANMANLAALLAMYLLGLQLERVSLAALVIAMFAFGKPVTPQAPLTAASATRKPVASTLPPW